MLQARTSIYEIETWRKEKTISFKLCMKLVEWGPASRVESPATSLPNSKCASTKTSRPSLSARCSALSKSPRMQLLFGSSVQKTKCLFGRLWAKVRYNWPIFESSSDWSDCWFERQLSEWWIKRCLFETFLPFPFKTTAHNPVLVESFVRTKSPENLWFGARSPINHH